MYINIAGIVFYVCIRSVRAVQAALGCIKKAAANLKLSRKPRVVVVSDTPSLVKDIAPHLSEFAEVLVLVLVSVSGFI